MPQSLLVFLGLVGGLAAIFIMNPPHTACNSQLNELTKEHTPFFIIDKSVKFQEKTEYQKSFESCQNTNSPGGCLNLFNGIKELVGTLQVIPSDCFSKICLQKAFNQPLWDTIDIIVRIGWGDQPPENVHERNKWLSYSHFLLFCQIKKILNTCHGEEKWQDEQEKILQSLPGADKMTRQNIWRLTLFATSCQRVF